MTSLLSRIDRPQDLHELSEDELQAVAQEVRELLIDTVGEIGGHFGANLGTCEIAVALHSLMDSPRDKILWDVGHQAYPHKVLTGRRDALGTIRQYGGLAPFCSIAESEHDIMGAGHASTSIGYAVGIKEAMLREGTEDGKVVAVIGDGAMTGGVAFEAVSQAGGLGTPIVVILNDNGMSIAPNVGALSRYMNRVRLDPGLWEAREGVEEKLTKLPAGIGAAFERLGPRFKESVKAFWAPGLWWEELDWAYLGVIDGHDVRAMRRALRSAFEAERPVVIHCATVKGKGFAPGRGRRPGGHGEVACRQAEVDLAAPPRAVASLLARAAAVHAGLRRRDGARVRARPARDRHHGRDELRHRPVDPAEGDARPLLRRRDRRAAGACCSPRAPRFRGMRPVAAIYSTFLQRAFDQIVHDVCLQNLPVTFCMDRAGLVGDDGPTHHGVFDIAYLRALPHITLMAPRDEAMLVHMLHTALHIDGPAAVRYPRGAGVGVELPGAPEVLRVGTGEILREGERVALVGYGTGVGKALGAADLLAERGLDVTVADARFAKPLDVPAAGGRWPPSTICSSPSRRASSPAASAARSGSPCPTRARSPRASCASACPTAT